MKKHLWLLYTPILALYMGIASNALVMAANHAQMPVLYPGGCPTEAWNEPNPGDIIHACMDSNTHLKILADWIVLGDGIASPGDMGIFFFYSFFWPMAAAYIALTVFGGKDEVMAPAEVPYSRDRAPQSYSTRRRF